MDFMQLMALGESDLAEAMSRSDYSDFMRKGLKGLLLDQYQKAAAETTFQEIVAVESSDSDHEEYPSLGDPEMPREVLEGEEYKNLAAGSPDMVKVTNFKYGGLISLTEEASEDDQTPGKRLARQAAQLGRKHMEFKDKVFWSLITSNPTIYDAQALFSLNHPGYTGGAARGNNDNIYTNVTLSANALAVVIGMVALWEGADADQDLNVRVTDLMVPIRLQQTALGLTRADLLPFAMGAGVLGPAATVSGGMPNAMKGKIGVISSHRLDKASTSDWYVKTNMPGLLHQTRKGLQFTQEAQNAGANFLQDVLRYKTSERFGRKLVQWRGFLLVS